jgi:hypothetical protein
MFKIPQYNTWIELGTNQNQKDILKYVDDAIFGCSLAGA